MRLPLNPQSDMGNTHYLVLGKTSPLWCTRSNGGPQLGPNVPLSLHPSVVRENDAFSGFEIISILRMKTCVKVKKLSKIALWVNLGPDSTTNQETTKHEFQASSQCLLEMEGSSHAPSMIIFIEVNKYFL